MTIGAFSYDPGTGQVSGPALHDRVTVPVMRKVEAQAGLLVNALAMA